ncbi:MAG: hypothetical protein DLM72_03595 [Candidatus Nitrosopolaris wilkensis]|nr:MAG: hypothetical protein DLM72_03595 [Candidatus Nitrosopolaris wilkensis]
MRILRTLKKVVKVVPTVVGLFFPGLAYLQYQQIVVINWNKFHSCRRMLSQHLQMRQLRSLDLTAVIQ